MEQQPLRAEMFGLNAVPDAQHPAPQAPFPPQAQDPAPQAPVAQPPAPVAQPATPAPFVPPQPQAPTPFAPQISTPSQYHHNVEFGSLDDEEIKTGSYESYKGTKGRTDRLGFLSPRRVPYSRVHYVDTPNRKGYFLCNSKFEKQGGQEVPKFQAPCCQKLGAPKKRFSALIAQYASDQSGRLLQPFGYTLKVWRFGEPLFDQVRTIARNFPLNNHDIFAKCTDPDYSRFELLPCNESLLAHEGFQKQYGAEVNAYIAAMDPQLDRTTGQALTPAEWAELLGAPNLAAAVGGVAPGADAPIITNLGDLLK